MKRTLLGMSLVLLAGCTTLPVGQNRVDMTGNATLELEPQIQSGGFQTLEVVENYSAKHIDHLVVKLFRVNGQTEEAVKDAQGNDMVKDIVKADLGKTVVFKNLRASTLYRIRSYAYQAHGEASTDLISVSGANSAVDVQVDYDDRPTMGKLRVKLKDKVFSAEATAGGVQVVDGGFVASGSETIE